MALLGTGGERLQMTASRFISGSPAACDVLSFTETGQ